MYGRLFSTEPCATLLYSELNAYSEPCRISCRNLDMVYELNERKNIYIIENLITLQIILRNEIPGNDNSLNVASTLIKVWLIFILKGTAN